MRTRCKNAAYARATVEEWCENCKSSGNLQCYTCDMIQGVSMYNAAVPVIACRRSSALSHRGSSSSVLITTND